MESNKLTIEDCEFKNNKLIAEFMGHKLDQLDEMGEPQCRIFEQGLGTKRIEDTYSKSWAWLMLVVDKIEDEGGAEVVQNNGVATISGVVNGNEYYQESIGKSRKDATYQAVLQFIKEFNKTKSCINNKLIEEFWDRDNEIGLDGDGWNWLMPVIKKCLVGEAEQSVEICSSIRNIYEGICNQDEEYAYKSVVEFIKQYNKTK